MIILEATPIPYANRKLKAILHPGLIFLQLVIVAIVYFIIQLPEFNNVASGLCVVLFVLMLILFFGYRYELNAVSTQIIKLEVTSQGLTLHQRVHDIPENLQIPLKQLQLDLKKAYNNRSKRMHYRLEMYDGNSVSPLFKYPFSNPEIAAILKTIEPLRSLNAGERDFLTWYERTHQSTINKVLDAHWSGMKLLRIFVGIPVLLVFVTLVYDQYVDDGQRTQQVFEMLISQPQSNTTSELINFPNTWHYLTKVGDEYERPARCGQEDRIEIVSENGQFIWREFGSFPWEAVVDNFSGAQDQYVIILTAVDGSGREMTLTLQDENLGTYLFGEKVYTYKPELFQLVNRVACP